MRIRQLVMIAAAALSGAAAADAQDNPYGGGTRLTGPPRAEIPTGPLSTENARIITYQLAACLVKRTPKRVASAIATEPWQSNARRILLSVVNEGCLENGEMAIPPELLRGALFQVLYHDKFSARAPQLTASSIDFAAGSSATPDDDTRTAIALRQFGDCVIRRDLNNAHAYVLARAGSNEETTALNALLPQFNACVVQGSTWRFNRSTMTAVLSEVLYREALVAEPAEASK